VLPTFDGDILKWNEFWAMFCATIHNRSDFSDVVKFTYLLPLLQGSARDAIEGIPVDNEHYAEVVAILQQHFDHGDSRVISKLLGEFHRLPQCGDQLSEKRKTFHACERIFRLLKLAGDDIDSSRSSSFLFLSKFPASMVRDLGKHYKVHTHSPLSAVRAAVEKSITEEELTASEIDDLSIVSMPQLQGYQKGIPVVVEQLDPVSSGPEPLCVNSACSTENSEAHFPYSCYFCGGPHFNSDCGVYKSANAREKRLFELKRCIRCGRNHLGQCSSEIRCYHCRTKDHITALCRKRFPERSVPATHSASCVPSQGPVADEQTTTPGYVNEIVSSQLNPNAPSFVTSCSAANGSTSQQTKRALFQTGKVLVLNSDTGFVLRLRIAFDSLSDRSYSGLS
jgi:hypothetical protein